MAPVRSGESFIGARILGDIGEFRRHFSRPAALALTPRKPSQYDAHHMKQQRPATTTRKQDSHDRIVEVASRGLRRDGCDSLGVADVMKQAGLTHGGFYAHFSSRDHLVAEAIEMAGRTSRAFM